MKKIGLIGQLGLEGALALLHKHRDALQMRFPRSFLCSLEEAAHIVRLIPSAAELLFVQEVAEGGLMGTLWNACEALSSLGCRVFADDIPIRQEVVEICEIFEENPYEMPSAGTYLLVWEEADPFCCSEAMQAILSDTAVIGYLTQENRRLFVTADFERYLTPPQRQQKDMADRRRVCYDNRVIL